MNILIIILLVIVALTALVLVAALFIKKEYSVRKEVLIDKPLAGVFDYVKQLRNQDEFSKWVRME